MTFVLVFKKEKLRFPSNIVSRETFIISSDFKTSKWLFGYLVKQVPFFFGFDSVLDYRIDVQFILYFVWI